MEEVKGTEARGSVVQDCVVQNMDHKVPTAASNQGDRFVNEEVVRDTLLVRLESNVIVHNDNESAGSAAAGQ